MVVTTIHFEDHGQDFLEWDIDDNGAVVDCRPFQRWHWCGGFVLNTCIQPGDIVAYSKPPHRLMAVRYPIARITSNTVDQEYPMYSDYELELWGDLFCKYEVHPKTDITFIQFMRLPIQAKRDYLKRALTGGTNHAKA